MPYAIRKKGKKWVVYNKDTGKSMGESTSAHMAIAHMRALYAAESGVKMGRKKGKKFVVRKKFRSLFSGRRLGHPRTEAERRARHSRLHPGTPLPPRGTGLGL